MKLQLNLSLPVLTEKPDGREMPFLGPKVIWSRNEVRPLKHWYFCPHCKGWIEGHPADQDVNDLDGRRRAGRRGTAYFCIRCTREISFSGMMS